MSKKRNTGVDLPDLANMDDLAVLSDEELAGRAARLETDRRRAASRGTDLRPWEEEVAYVRREQAIRKDRYDAHVAFLQGSMADVEPIDLEPEAGAVLN